MVILTYALFGLIVILFYTGKYITDDYKIQNDFRQLLQCVDYRWPGELRENDILLQYAKYAESPAISLIYRVGALFMNPIVYGKILSLILFSVTMAMIGWMVCTRSSFMGGIIAILIISFFPTQIDRFYGIFSRSFSAILYILLLYFSEKGNKIGCGIVATISAIFYPPVFFLIVVYLVFYVVFTHTWQDKKTLSILAVSMIAGISFLLLKYFSPSDFVGSLISRDEMYQMIEMHEGGRYPFLPQIFVLTDLKSRVLQPYYVFLFILCSFLYSPKKLKLPSSISFMFLASIFTYLLALAVSPRLYLPDRYTRYIIPYLVAYIFGIWTGGIFRLEMSVRKKTVIFLLMFFPGIYTYQQNIHPGYKMDSIRHKELYETLRKTPQKSMIAAPPYIADNIPLYSHRSVLFNYELTHPWYPKYYGVLSERISDFYRSYYNPAPDRVLAFAKKYDVDYIIVEKEYFTKKYIERGKWLFSPWNDRIREYIMEVQADKYWWERNSSDLKKIYNNDGLIIVEIIRQ